MHSGTMRTGSIGAGSIAASAGAFHAWEPDLQLMSHIDGHHFVILLLPYVLATAVDSLMALCACAQADRGDTARPG